MIQIENIKDIKKLIEGKIEESLILEYKREITDNNKEIAKDLFAFANTDGGSSV